MNIEKYSKGNKKIFLVINQSDSLLSTLEVLKNN